MTRLPLPVHLILYNQQSCVSSLCSTAIIKRSILLRQTLHIVLILVSLQLPAQVLFDPDTVRFIKISDQVLAETFKNDLLIDHRGLLWVASGKGLFTFDGYDWKSGLSQPNDPLAYIDQYLENVQEDSNGMIWFGTQSSGLIKLNPQTAQVKAFLPEDCTGMPVHNSIYNDLNIVQSELLLLTAKGFIRYNPIEEQFIDLHIPFRGKGGSESGDLENIDYLNQVHHFRLDTDSPNIAWLGTRGGLVRYHLDSKKAEAIHWPFINPVNQRPRSVMDVLQGGDSLLIATYGGGFITYQKDLSRFRQDLIEPENELNPDLSNVIQDIKMIDAETFLFASNLGSGVYHWPTGKFQFFQFPIQSKPLGYFRNILVDHNGCIWTNSWAGVYRSQNPVFTPTRDPKLLITSCKITNGPNQIGYLSGGTDPIILQKNQNTIDITYALANPVKPDYVRYSYILDGFEDEWVDSENRRFARYTNLRGGKYTFKVRAVDPLSKTYETELLEFHIRTPFYQSGWFIFLIGLAGALLLFYLDRMRLQKVRLEEKLNSEFDLKLSKMEMQALRSQMNPHFIFNSLNSIKSYVVNKGPDAAADYLTKFAQLIRVILENSKSELLTLDQEIKALRLYIEIENLRFTEMFDYKIEVDDAIDQYHFRIPPMLIQPHVENAIWHGLMHKEGDRKLSVRFEKNENGIHCAIEDNGIGREKAAELAQTRKFKKQSLGTKITRDRIQMMNSLYATDVRINVIDLEDNITGRALGTIVEIDIPVLRESFTLGEDVE